MEEATRPTSPSPSGPARDAGNGPPRDEPPRDARASWLLGRVLLLLVAFSLFALPLARVGTVRSPAWEALEEATEGEGKKPIGFAILGNSRPRAGVSPRLISASLEAAGFGEVRGYNFSVDGTDSLHHASFGRSGLLRMNPSPRLVVWAVDPLMFDATRKANRLEQLERRDIPTLLEAGAPFELVLDVGLMNVFPPYRHRPPVLLKVEDKTEGLGKRLAKLQKRLGLYERESPRPRVYEPEGDGYEPFRVVADWEYRFYQRHAVHYAGEYQKLTVSQWHASFARSFLSAAREWGVVVVLVEVPAAPYYREHFANGKKHLAWREQLQKIAADEGAIFWNHIDRYGSDKDFGDPGHMHRATAEDYSKFLGAALAADPRIKAAFARPSKGR